MPAYLYVYPDLARHGVVEHDALDATTERHALLVRPPREVSRGDALTALAAQPQLDGVVLQLARGFLDRAQLTFAANVLRTRRRLWVYWPV